VTFSRRSKKTATRRTLDWSKAERGRYAAFVRRQTLVRSA
jgi:hypothetical protein